MDFSKRGHKFFLWPLFEKNSFIHSVIMSYHKIIFFKCSHYLIILYYFTKHFLCCWIIFLVCYYLLYLFLCCWIFFYKIQLLSYCQLFWFLFLIIKSLCLNFQKEYWMHMFQIFKAIAPNICMPVVCNRSVT